MTDAAVPIRLVGKAITPRIPTIFAPISRSGEQETDKFLPPGLLIAKRAFDVSAAARDAAGAAQLEYRAEPDEILVIELNDGSTLVTSATRFQQSLRRAHPELVGEDGAVLFEKLRIEGSAPHRGFAAVVGGLVSKVFTFVAGRVTGDLLEDTAEKFGVELGVSWAGTKALMAVIESGIDRAPGLYRWTGAGRKRDDLQTVSIGDLAASEQKPMLVFIHGTASSTHGSFGDLCEAGTGFFAALQRRFSGGIYAYEHRTLSVSPIENAIHLLRQLPFGARVSLVSHSRGGIVADLLCLRDFDAAIDNYDYRLKGTGDADESESARVKQQLSGAHEEQREQLRELARLLRERSLVVERYVRVASPASGTKLVGNNLDLFLSGLLTLIGQVPYLLGSPIYSALKRIVIEIAKNRTNPHLVPGVEPMLPDSPMARLLRDAPVREGTQMAVIAGDIEGGNLLQRLGVLLTDYLIFDKEDNDLVVDTRAMLTGVAPKLQARVLFERGSSTSHFGYFRNFEPRSALRDWLLATDPLALPAFRRLPSPAEYAAALAEATHRGANEPDLPVVVVLPGVMGSHLRRGPKDRVWFDPLDLATGGLKKIAWPQPCEADDLFGLFYGKLCKHLATSHRVERFAYDWRQPMDVLGERLGEFLTTLLSQTRQPVRLLAHSMGGLVVRACIYRRRTIMDSLMQREGARLLMLGTPNQGACSMVENLLGKGDAVRALARIDFADSLQEVLDVIADFRGALQLLPKPGFRDAFQGHAGGGETLDFQKSETWAALKTQVKDFWFGDNCCATPDQAALDAASWLWRQDGTNRPALPDAYKTKSVYVFGVARNTPCGVRRDQSCGGRLKMVGTAHGDGSVTWESGRIDGIGSYYYMPASHGDLTCTKAHFGAIVDLLSTGATTRLSPQPPALREIEKPAPVLYDAGPPSIEDAESRERGLMGGTLQNQFPPKQRRRLEVRVKAVDLRFATQPILVGHYEHDPIAGPEAIIDRELLGGELSVRHSLGLYAGAHGSGTVVLRIPNEFERKRGSLCGAIVTGFGEYSGQLNSADVTDAVRTGVLRYLLQVVDVLGKTERSVSLSTLLLGYNSTANLSITASVESLVRGVLQANHEFYEKTQLDVSVGQLDIIELYLDTAITAAYALRNLANGLGAAATKQGTTLVCYSELEQGDGARQRLFDSSSAGYWPRLLVTDADRNEESCPLKSNVRNADAVADATSRASIAERLRFLYVGQRARAESVAHQRQPGLIETIVRQQIHSSAWQQELGRMLFQLMIPPEFKDAARQLERLVLVLDSYTANLPWELMLGDDPMQEGEHLPLAVRTRVVRQLAASEFRCQVRHAVGRTALVIGNPSLDGVAQAFPCLIERPNGALPPPLPGAQAEATAVSTLLRGAGYDVMAVIGEEQTAVVALAALYQKPWRILHVSAHGVFGLKHRDGLLRSGVLLSDGLLITAAEICAMEIVPELVFLSCCHLGALDYGRDANKLAASVARELIANGVRCVVVAGWAVSDDAAAVFGEIFYTGLLIERLAFGDAVFEARKAVWERQPGDITWGAFQAYGDPGWLAEPRASVTEHGTSTHLFASIHECIDELSQLRISLSQNRDTRTEDDVQSQLERIASLLRDRCPAQWLNQPALQSALAWTYRELTQFEQARAAFLASIRADHATGVVPIRDIELLANIESRWGEKLAVSTLLNENKGEEGAEAPDGEKLVDLALGRLKGLNELLQLDLSHSTALPLNPERAALLGSAWKRKASVYAQRLLPDDISPEQEASLGDQLIRALENSVEAYRCAEGTPGSELFRPYLALNRLALDALTTWTPGNAKDEAIALAHRCAECAAKGFTARPNAWDALMQADACMVEHLLDGKFHLGEKESQEAFEKVAIAYAEATAHITLTPVQLDSAADHLQLLSRFCRALSRVHRDGGWATAADRLLKLSAQLKPGRPNSDCPI